MTCFRCACVAVVGPVSVEVSRLSCAASAVRCACCASAALMVLLLRLMFWASVCLLSMPRNWLCIHVARALMSCGVTCDRGGGWYPCGVKNGGMWFGCGLAVG